MASLAAAKNAMLEHSLWEGSLWDEISRQILTSAAIVSPRSSQLRSVLEAIDELLQESRVHIRSHKLSVRDTLL